MRAELWICRVANALHGAVAFIVMCGSAAFVAMCGAAALAAWCDWPAFSAHAAPVVYPAKGQSPGQTDGDKYACFEWSRAQSGFDPMQPAAAPAAASPAPTTNTAGMNGSLARGAAGGAAVAELADRDAGKGAAVGFIGAAARERIKQQSAQTQQQQQQQQMAQQQQAARAQQRSTFDRAFGACMEGRGYVVK